MRRIMIIIVTALGLMCVNVASADLIQVVPGAPTVDLGDQVSVDVVFDPLGPGGSLLGGFDITIGWDDSILALLNWVVDPTGALGPAPVEFVSPGPDMINVFAVSIFSDLTPFQDQDSPFSLFTLTFDAVGLGDGSIDFLSLLLSDETGFFPIFPEIIPGPGVTVQEPISIPEPSTLALFGIGLFGVLLAVSRKA